jgi:hypothetical protein
MGAHNSRRIRGHFNVDLDPTHVQRDVDLSDLARFQIECQIAGSKPVCHACQHVLARRELLDDESPARIERDVDCHPGRDGFQCDGGARKRGPISHRCDLPAECGLTLCKDLRGEADNQTCSGDTAQDH